MSESALNLGHSMTASDIQKKLIEMNPGFSFDAAVNRPSDYQYLLKGGDNMQDSRGGVFYNGQFICAMDRGVIPEKEIWSMKDGFEEIRMCDIDRYDDTRVVYVQILKSDPYYHQALLKAQKEDDNFRLDGDGEVYKYTALREGKVRDKVMTIGWRNTLLQIAFSGIPNVDIESVNEKFGVRL